MPAPTSTPIINAKATLMLPGSMYAQALEIKNCEKIKTDAKKNVSLYLVCTF